MTTAFDRGHGYRRRLLTAAEGVDKVPLEAGDFEAVPVDHSSLVITLLLHSALILRPSGSRLRLAESRPAGRAPAAAAA
jgi:hypothetical protein